jgi:hypothetical protein
VEAARPTRPPSVSRSALFGETLKLREQRNLSLGDLGIAKIRDSRGFEILTDGFFHEVPNIAALGHGEVAQFLLHASRKLYGYAHTVPKPAGEGNPYPFAKPVSSGLPGNLPIAYRSSEEAEPASFRMRRVFTASP